MIGRQWQFEELRGEDGGSPILAEVEAERAPVTRFHAGSPVACGRPGCRRRWTSPAQSARSRSPSRPRCQPCCRARARRDRAAAAAPHPRRGSAPHGACQGRGCISSASGRSGSAIDAEVDPVGAARRRLLVGRVPDAAVAVADLAARRGPAGRCGHFRHRCVPRRGRLRDGPRCAKSSRRGSPSPQRYVAAPDRHLLGSPSAGVLLRDCRRRSPTGRRRAARGRVHRGNGRLVLLRRRRLAGARRANPPVAPESRQEAGDADAGPVSRHAERPTLGVRGRQRLPRRCQGGIDGPRAPGARRVLARLRNDWFLVPFATAVRRRRPGAQPLGGRHVRNARSPSSRPET